MAARFEENISECPESESVELNAGPQPPKRRKETKITNFFTSRNAVSGWPGWGVGGWGAVGGREPFEVIGLDLKFKQSEK